MRILPSFSLPGRDSPVFRTKSISQLIDHTSGRHSLKRTLKPLDLLLLGIGAIIGTGIFVVTGIAAADYSGPALVLSFLISGIVCIFAALCYAELSTLVPAAGSAYTYCYASMGEIWAWIIGWDLILEYGLAVAAVSIGWSGYAVHLAGALGISLPVALTAPPGAEGGLFNLPAFLIVLFITGLLVLGMRESARVNAIVVGIKIAVVLLFVVLSVWSVDTANWDPFMPFGWMGVFSGAAIVFFAYIGFDAVVTAAEEIENPQRSLPIGIIGSLAICMILYVVVSAILTGVVPYTMFQQEAARSAPVAFALNFIGFPWAAALVAIGAVCGMTSVLLVLLFGQTRIFFAMSRDGLLPGIFRDVNPQSGSPVKATLLVGCIVAALAGLISLKSVASLVNMGTLAAFMIVGCGVILLRKKHPELPRPFRCPLVPWIPACCIISCLVLILSLGLLAQLLFVVWLAIGLTIYFLYGMQRHGRNTVPLEMNPTHPEPAFDLPEPRVPASGSMTIPGPEERGTSTGILRRGEREPETT
ncbi:MAG: amino acid permease [Methanoregulaceae archaeon]